jgi:hypothetical protein
LFLSFQNQDAGADDPINNNVLPSNTNFRCPLCRQSADTLIPLFDYNDYLIIQDNKESLKPIERLHQSMMRPSRPKLVRKNKKT